MTKSLSHRVKTRIQSLGFTAPFICKLSEFSDRHGEHLADFLKQEHHGTMSWMVDTFKRRRHPLNLWPEAKSAIVLGFNYGPDTDPLANLEQLEKAVISVYARNRDYHDIIKGKLKEIAGLLAKDLDADVKVFVDTAPLMEKPLAQQAGLGWQGKHTNLVSRDYGSWLFLGTILTDADLDPSPAEIDNCGTCRACLDICPTDAFTGPYKLDARKCISYLTIEHKGPIDLELRGKLGNHIYGCDDCLAVCPWNKFAQAASEAKLKARDDLEAPDLAELISLDEDGFRRKFSGSPIKRIGWERFIRNVIYAIGNSRSSNLAPYLTPFINHQSTTLRDAAIWAVEAIEE